MWGQEGVGFYPEPPAEVPPGKNTDPDRERSTSALYVEERENDIVYVLQVKGLGAIMMRASYSDDDQLRFNGLSTFTESEIGFY
jgi:hypothetical protein